MTNGGVVVTAKHLARWSIELLAVALLLMLVALIRGGVGWQRWLQVLAILLVLAALLLNVPRT